MTQPPCPTAPATDEAVADVERLRVGDRLASFSVLLPAEPDGDVLLAVPDGLAGALRARFPRAVRHEPGRPPAAGSVGLLIRDARHCSDDLSAALAEQAVVATLGRRGRYAVYPELHHPQQVWRRGWPLPAMVGPVSSLKRAAGLWAGAKRAVPRLAVRGPRFVSLADRIAADLGATVGEALDLVGIVTAGHTVLRLRGSRDYAVRLTWHDTGADILRENAVRRVVPAIAPLLADEIARGRTCGVRWAATPWIPARQPALRDCWGHRERRVAAAERVAAGLQTVCTGRTGPGWAARWCARTTLLPSHAVEPLVRAMLPVEAGLPTGWCHGDPWPGNVLLDRDTAVVIDWDNAAPDAPMGVDWLLIAALQLTGPRVCMAAACARLVDEPVLVRQPVAGRRWHAWERPQRVALALAAFLLYLRNRALHDLGTATLERNVAAALALADTAEADDALLPWDADGSPPEGGGAVGDDPPASPTRGAGWLGIGAAVSKGAQTVVLLALAALLAPAALGLLAVGALVVNVCSAVTDLGSSTALVYWRGDVERAARSALTVALGLGLSITALCWVAAPALAGALHAGTAGVGVIRGLTAVLPCYAVAAVSQEMLRRELRFARRVLPDMAAAVLGAAVALLLAFTGHGVASLVVGQIVQGVAVMVLCWLVRRPVRPGWRSADVRGLLGYGGHIAGANIVQLLLLNVDYVLVARLLGPDDLGEYSLAFRLAYLPFINVAFVCCGAAFPYLCRLRGPAVGRAAVDTAVRAMTLVAPLYLGMALFAPQLEVLGRKWAPAVPVVRWLAAYGLLLTLVQVAQTTLNAVGRPRDTLVLRTLHLVVLAVVLAVVTRHGIVAVGIGQAVAAGLVLAVAAAMTLRQVLGVALPRLAGALLPCLLGCLMMLAAVGVERTVAAPSLAPGPVVAAGTCALAAYAATVWSLRRRGGRAAWGRRA